MICYERRYTNKSRYYYYYMDHSHEKKHEVQLTCDTDQIQIVPLERAMY